MAKNKLRGPFIVEEELDNWATAGDIERWANTGKAQALDGCLVDTDNHERCCHGYPTWILALGLRLSGGKQEG